MRRMLFAVLLAALPAMAPAESRVPASAAEIALSFSPVVKAAAPAVVNIYARRVVQTRTSPFANDPFFSQLFGSGRTVPRVQNSLGSGVILDPSGIVVSNFHVVGGATDIRVVLADGREFDANVLLADRDSDLAVIRLADAADLPALELADSDTAEVGDLVLAIGNPFGVGQTVTSGIVSGLARSGIATGSRAGYFIQTDAPINPGNSGGALVDMSARLLGINTSILTRSGGSNGIGFAIPANLVRQYVEQARDGATRLARPWSGASVQEVDAGIAEALGLGLPKGVVITRLAGASPLAQAGLQEGDVLLRLNGMPVDAPAELDFRMLTLGIGAEASVDFLHDGSETTAMVALIAAPDDPPRQQVQIEAESSLGGLVAANVNPAVIEELNLPLDSTGVAVMQVRGYAARTGLLPGDLLLEINGKPVASTADLTEIARTRPFGWQILFERQGRRNLLRIRDR